MSWPLFLPRSPSPQCSLLPFNFLMSSHSNNNQLSFYLGFWDQLSYWWHGVIKVGLDTAELELFSWWQDRVQATIPNQKSIFNRQVWSFHPTLLVNLAVVTNVYKIMFLLSTFIPQWTGVIEFIEYYESVTFLSLSCIMLSYNGDECTFRRVERTV